MSSERTNQSELMSRKRKGERDIVIPPVADPERRLLCEADPYRFMETYLPESFDRPWNRDRKRIVDEILYRIEFGGDKAIAAPRGGGKTTITEALVGVYAPCKGMLSFPLIVAATGPDADRVLSNIKVCYEFNETLAADYPEVCFPVQSLEGAPQRCNMQTVLGERTRMRWSGNIVQFPTVTIRWCPECYRNDVKDFDSDLECRHCGHRFQPYQSVMSGTCLATRGLDAAIRGVKIGSKRPDFVLIDDPETRESARSDVQISQRMNTIEKDIGGLGSTRKPVTRLMLTTIQNVVCLSYQYTDRTIKPSWDGDRLALVLKWPDRKDLWDEYVEKRSQGMQNEPPDKTGRAAHLFYEENREAMDEGCIVSDEERFKDYAVDDGSQCELSTIQHVQNEAADKGWDYVLTELQNNPPEEEVSEADNLTFGIVTGTHQQYAGRLTKDKAGFVPDDTEKITSFVDVQRDRLYYEIVAWRPGKMQHVAEYGCTGLNLKSHEIGTHDATVQRLLQLRDYWLSMPLKQNGVDVWPDITIVDSGDGETMQAVYEACLINGWRASKGASPYVPKQTKTKLHIPNKAGAPWHESPQRCGSERIKLILYDADWWKHRCRDAWRTIPGEPGSVTIYGKDSREHTDFGKQMSSAKFIQEFIDGKGWKRQWIEGQNNHYWDCHCGNMLAASVAGVLGFGPQKKQQQEVVKLSDIARSKWR